MLFFALTINYFDRSLLGVMAPKLMEIFNWSNKDYALVNMSFKTAYAIGLLLMGRLIDRLGTKKGFTLSIIIWSIFGMLHATISKSFALIGFVLARFGLGFGEAGTFLQALKLLLNGFPRKREHWQQAFLMLLQVSVQFWHPLW